MAGSVRSFACSHFAAKQSPAACAPNKFIARGLQKEADSESWRCCAFCALHYLEKITTLLSVLNELCAGCVVEKLFKLPGGVVVWVRWLRRCGSCLLLKIDPAVAVCHCLLKISAQIIITDGPFNAWLMDAKNVHSQWARHSGAVHSFRTRAPWRDKRI